MSFFDNFFNKCSCDGQQVYPATITPIMDGVGYVGSSAKYAREDHVHPSDTSKQDTLISGANIKTVNGESLLGGGDLVIGGGGGGLEDLLTIMPLTDATITLEDDLHGTVGRAYAFSLPADFISEYNYNPVKFGAAGGVLSYAGKTYNLPEYWGNVSITDDLPTGCVGISLMVTFDENGDPIIFIQAGWTENPVLTASISNISVYQFCEALIQLTT